MSKNDFDGAISNLEALCNLEPDTPGYHISLADVCIQAGKFDMADSECRKALQLSPDLAMPHYLLAEKANKQENYLEAVVQLTQAISLKDDYFEAYLLRGQVLCRMMQFGEAEKDADVLMQHNGDESEEVLRLKSCVCAHTGRESEAAELLEAPPWKFWTRIGIPVLMPSILDTFGLLFANAITAYATVILLVTTSIPLLPVKITTMFTGEMTQQKEMGAALAIWMVFLMLLVIAVCNFIKKRLCRGGQ